jgi:hypothetical protein
VAGRVKSVQQIRKMSKNSQTSNSDRPLPSFRNEDRFKERQEFEENLAKLRELALAELERQGYDVRGKTPGQIRELIRRRPRNRAARPEAKSSSVER